MSHSPPAFYTVEEEEPETIIVDPRKYAGMTKVTHKDLEAFFLKQGATEAEAKRWTGKLFEDRAPLHSAEGSRNSPGQSAFEIRARQGTQDAYESTGIPPRAPSPPVNPDIPYGVQSEEGWKESREFRGRPYDGEYFHASRSNTSTGYDYYQPEYRPEPHSSRSNRDYPRESTSHRSPRPRSPVPRSCTCPVPDSSKSSSSRPPRRTEIYSTPEADYITVDYDFDYAHCSSFSSYSKPSPPRRRHSSREPSVERPSTKHERSIHRHKSEKSSRSEPKRSESHREPSSRKQHSSGHMSPSRRRSSSGEHRSHRPSPHIVSPTPSSYLSEKCDYEPSVHTRGQWPPPNIVSVSPTHRTFERPPRFETTEYSSWYNRSSSRRPPLFKVVPSPESYYEGGTYEEYEEGKGLELWAVLNERVR